MENPKLTLSFEVDKNVLCCSANMLLAQLGQPTMSEEEILKKFCNPEPTIVTFNMMPEKEVPQMIMAFLCLILGADEKKKGA